QPATLSFYYQRNTDIGNYPFGNDYLHFKLSKTRFYLMMSHVNQGLTGTNYFSMPHYPMNPRRFQLGLSIDFAN
ncbi:MAG: putative porin, partial [Muribaculaceae bacterium]|nr:putative porin [Muribaculaceae bacterium]